MNNPEHEAWLCKAENDWLNIQNNLSAARIPWDTVCFHAQQTAEKVLKAFLIYHGISPSRTHDLVAVLGECVKIDSQLLELEPACQSLTYYAINPRYPDDAVNPGEREAREMIEAADLVRTEIMKRIK